MEEYFMKCNKTVIWGKNSLFPILENFEGAIITKVPARHSNANLSTEQYFHIFKYSKWFDRTGWENWLQCENTCTVGNAPSVDKARTFDKWFHFICDLKTR